MRYPLLEGFDHYAAVSGADGALNTRWNVIINALTFVTGLGGDGKALQFGASGPISQMYFAYEASAKFTVHFATRIDNLGGAAFNPFLCFAKSIDQSQQLKFYFDAAGHIILKNNANVLLATGTIPLAVSQVYRCVFTCDIAAGTISLSVNGDVDEGFALTGNANIEAVPTPDMIGLGISSNTSVSHTMDDIILGIDECVDWGPQEINTLVPTADVAVAWTKSAGVTNHENVDDIPFDVDATYNSSATAGQQDIFDYGDPPHNPESVLCVELLTVMRKEESAVRKAAEVIRVGGTDYVGTEHNLAETYGHWFTVWDKNPATNSPWLPADIAAIQGGYKATVIA